MTKATTPEQIAEAIGHLRSIGSFTRDSAYSICNEAADLIEALAARLAEARGQLRYQRILTEQIQTSHDLAATAAAEAQERISVLLVSDLANSRDATREHNRADEAEVAVASAREMALEAARRLETMAILAEGNVSGGVLPRDAVIAVVNQYLKSTPPAPVTPLTESEVMPDTSGSRSNSGDNATPQASTLAPGADAPEPDLLTIETLSFPYPESRG